jgi:hypothetical protein
MDGP